tara:strand:+ start:472 stop:741 length:270 start_codon:yes stop_codon:yes gene_type:complete
MTKITKNKTDKNMHSHKETLEFLSAYLKKGYAVEAQARLKKKSIPISTTMIRNIKSGDSIDWKVLEVLAEMALEIKKAKEKVEHLVSNN